MYPPAIETDGVIYDHRAIFQLSLDEGNVGKGWDLVMGLPVPRGSFYPEVIARLDELSEEAISLEEAGILLGPHLSHEAREGGVTTMLDLFH